MMRFLKLAVGFFYKLSCDTSGDILSTWGRGGGAIMIDLGEQVHKSL